MKADDRVFSNLGDGHEYDGLTARDYIAIQAMNGVLAKDINTNLSDADIARICYAMADEMIKASNEP